MKNINKILREKIEETKKNCQIIDEVVTQGVITKRFGEYCKEMTTLEFLSEEAGIFSEIGNYDETIQSLTDMKIRIDAAIEPYLTDYLNTIALLRVPTHLQETNPYQELYDFAKAKYETAVQKCEQRLLISV
jgi:hypothetical protein